MEEEMRKVETPVTSLEDCPEGGLHERDEKVRSALADRCKKCGAPMRPGRGEGIF